ncbi:MAG: DnaJ domain-containing protein [Patescibacteria group bacterium]
MTSHLPAESPATKRLRALLAKKKQEFSRLAGRLERLKDELLELKYEHDMRIGRLTYESDMLDYSLFESKKINDLMVKGYTYADARKLVEERTFSEFAKAREREQEALGDEGAPSESGHSPKVAQSAELKKLFRKLAHKYHPDLAEGNAEKMKEINRAYSEGNIDALRAIERGVDEDLLPEAIPETDLSAHLRTIDVGIVRLKQRLRAFTKSEWYALKREIEKARKEEQDFFATWEKKLKAEIAKKRRELTKIKSGFSRKG